jgi:hypothetical protein
MVIYDFSSCALSPIYLVERGQPLRFAIALQAGPVFAQQSLSGDEAYPAYLIG